MHWVLLSYLMFGEVLSYEVSTFYAIEIIGKFGNAFKHNNNYLSFLSRYPCQDGGDFYCLNFS